MLMLDAFILRVMLRVEIQNAMLSVVTLRIVLNIIMISIMPLDAYVVCCYTEGH